MVCTVGIFRDFAYTPPSAWVRFFPTPVYLCDYYMSPLHQLGVTSSHRSGVPCHPGSFLGFPITAFTMPSFFSDHLPVESGLLKTGTLSVLFSSVSPEPSVMPSTQ